MSQKGLRILGVSCLAAGGLLSPAVAAETNLPSPLQGLLECRSTANEAERLACYDREAARLEEGRARDNLVVLDRDQLRKARRSVFGLTLPDLSILGGEDADRRPDRLDSKIIEAAQTANRKWVLKLEDGGTWIQTDTRDFPIEPRAGHPIQIRKGSLSAYFATVKDQGSVRVKRLR